MTHPGLLQLSVDFGIDHRILAAAPVQGFIKDSVHTYCPENGPVWEIRLANDGFGPIIMAGFNARAALKDWDPHD